jgi:ketosteroid isomerase-like protein
MSQENVELVRAAFEDFLAGNREFGAGLLDPGIVSRPPGSRPKTIADRHAAPRGILLGRDVAGKSQPGP